jgi:hypothetical protein
LIPAAASKLTYRFIIGAFVPAAAFVGAVTFASEWAPQIRTTTGSELDVTVLAGVVFVASAALATVLETFNYFVIRVLEGFAIPAWAARRGRQRWVARFRQINGEIEKLLEKKTDASYAKAYRLQQERHARFPTEEHDVLSTELGNVIAAWEHYPFRRYGIDAIVLWPRLAPLLSKPVAEAIGMAKARFDFFLNVLILFPVWGLLRSTILAQTGETWRRAIWLLAGIGAAVLAWRMCIATATEWGNTVKAAFDLHRLDVLKQMGVSIPASWPETNERDIWREVVWPMKFDYKPTHCVEPGRENTMLGGGSAGGKAEDDDEA